MRFVVLGTTKFTLSCTLALLHCGAELAALVSLPRHALPDNSANIAGFAAAHGISYRELDNLNDPASVAWLKGLDADYLFSSWPKILAPEVLQTPRFFTIGTHPTELPRNRGRHPLHWLIALGIPASKLTYFRMDQGIDTGTILHQEPFSIGGDDDIAAVVARVNDIAYRGTLSLHQLLSTDPDAPGAGQDEQCTNSWRKRTPHDSLIDPRLGANTIIRAVRSFAPPYPAASLIVNDQVLKIVAAVQVTPPCGGAGTDHLEPGKVLAADSYGITLKAADGVVRLTTLHPVPETAQRVKYIHPPTRYLSCYPELASRL